MIPFSICMPSQVPDTLNPETAIFNMNRLEQNHLEKKLTAGPPILKTHRLAEINNKVYMFAH